MLLLFNYVTETVVAVANSLEGKHKKDQTQDPICDNCSESLVGVLHYKCLSCPNYLLCRNCRVTRLQKKVHLEHGFRPISSIGTKYFIRFTFSHKNDNTQK